MTPTRRPSRLDRRPFSGALPAVLLSLSLLFMGLLALQAYRAERARRDGARRALDGYAQVVAFQFAAEAYQALNRETPAAFAALDRAAASERGVDALLAQPSEAARCGADLGEDRWSFSFPVPAEGQSIDSVLTSAFWGGSPPPEPERLRIVERVRARLTGLTLDGGYRVLLEDGPGRAAIAVAIRWRPAPENTSVYGFRTCFATTRGSLFRGAMTGRTSLPPSIIGEVPTDSVYSARVEAGAGRVLWVSPAPPVEIEENTASQTLWPPFDDLSVTVALRPAMQARLVPDATGSRLGTTLLLFGLNGVLLLAALVQMHRERQLVRLREGFVSAVSHELRTPLQQMLLYGDLLQLGGLKSDDERAHAAEVVARETRRLIHLVDNVLEFRPDGPGPVSARADTAYPVDDLVATVVEEFEPLAAARRARLVPLLEARTSTTWHPDAVRRVLLNLFDNAVKYGPQSGTITVRSAAEGPFLVLAVEDEGPGVPAAERQAVFEPYTRGEAHADSDTGGTGIGLAIVRDLCRAAGGDASMEAAVRGGARVVVRVPFVEAASHNGEAS